MKKILSVILLAVFMFSCSGGMEDREKKTYIDYTVETLSSSQLVNMLMIHNDFDYEQLSRVLGCSVHTLKRVQSGQTVFTNSGELQVKTLLKDVLFEKKIRQHDSERNSLRKRVMYGTFWTHSFNDEFETNIDWKWEEAIEK